MTIRPMFYSASIAFQSCLNLAGTDSQLSDSRRKAPLYVTPWFMTFDCASVSAMTYRCTVHVDARSCIGHSAETGRRKHSVPSPVGSSVAWPRRSRENKVKQVRKCSGITLKHEL